MMLNRGALIALGIAVAATLAGMPAVAQDTRALFDRIERLERELGMLQGQFYKGGGAGDGRTVVITSPELQGGGSGSALPTDAAARIEVKLARLENGLRELTGRLEETSFQIMRLGDRLDKAEADTDLRLRELESRFGSGAGVAAPPAVPEASGQPGTLGTISQQDLASFQAAPPPASGQPAPPAVDAAAVPPAEPVLKGETPKERYEYAFNLIRTDYGAAERALAAFIDAHPDDPLASNAQYWLGETHYVRADYQNAAVVFLEGYQKHPKGPKAPDSLLKLGLSLSSMGQQKEACAALARLAAEFPGAGETIKRRNQAERQKLGCP